MTECFTTEFKEQLPELAAGTLDAGATALVTQHVATCAACASELEMLRAVRAAQIPVPFMNISRIVRALPAAPVPVRPELPWYRRASIQMAAAFLLVAGGLISVRQAGDRMSVVSDRVATASEQLQNEAAPAASLQASAPAAGPVAERDVATPSAKVDIALVAGLDEMTTDELTSLLKDVDALAAVPVVEPEQFSPVSATSDSQGAR